MVSKKDEISLIVECHYSPSSKLRMLWEERSKQPANSYTYFGVKIIENQFRNMFSGNCMMFYMLLILNTGNFKDCKHTFQMSYQQLPAIGVAQDHYVGVVQCFRMFVNLLKLHISSGVVSNVVKDHHNFLQKIIYFNRRFQLSSDEYLNRSIILKNIIKLIKHSFIIFFNKFLTSFLLIFYCNWFLSLCSWQFLSFSSLFHLYLILYYIPFVMYLYSFLLVFYLVRLLFESSSELLHTFRPLPYCLCLLFVLAHLQFMGFAFLLFYHC